MKRPLVLGDFSARNVVWGNEFCNTYGESLIIFCDEISFNNNSPSEHSFVNTHFNGGSVTDLCVRELTLCIDLSAF